MGERREEKIDVQLGSGTYFGVGVNAARTRLHRGGRQNPAVSVAIASQRVEAPARRPIPAAMAPRSRLTRGLHIIGVAPREFSQRRSASATSGALADGPQMPPGHGTAARDHSIALSDRPA